MLFGRQDKIRNAVTREQREVGIPADRQNPLPVA